MNPAALVSIKRLIAANLLVQIFVSHELWLPVERLFPTAPAFTFFDFPSFFHLIFACVLILALCLILLFPKQKIWLFVFLCCTFLMVLADLNRLQVWLYQQWWLLWLFTFEGKISGRFMRSLLLFSLAAVYFWSGVSKLNAWYATDIFPWLFGFSDQKNSNFLQFAAFASAIFEALLGLSLLFKKTRPVGKWGILLMHIAVLTAIGPFFKNWNQVVWSWNILMPFLVFILIKNADFQSFKKEFASAKTPAALYTIVFLIIPLLDVFGLKEDQLAFKMYAGTETEATIYFSKKDSHCLPAYLYDEIIKMPDSSQYLELDFWAQQELSVPAYPSSAVFKKIVRKICPCLENGGVEIMYVESRWDKNATRFEKIPCESL